MPARTSRAKATADELLMELILHERLQAGDKLPTEDELSAALQISRNSVREAIRSLRALGIVEIRHPQGTFLCDASLAGLTRGLAFWSRVADRNGLDAVRPIADVREVLEVNLIGQVVDRLGSVDLRTIERLVRGMEQAAERNEYAPDLDRQFHEAVFRPLDNWVFSYLLQSFWDVYATVRDQVDRTSWSPTANAGLHRDILQALVDRDPTAATQAMSRHFDNSLRRQESETTPRTHEEPESP